MNKNLLQHTVLAKSVLKAAYRLGLNEEGLKKVLKFNDASPIVKLDPTSEFGQQGLLLIQLFQSLSSLTNGEEAAIKIFMNSKNHLTKGIPIQQIEDRVGLINVVECVESLSLSRRTLESWEQGARRPSGAATSLIRLFIVDPKFVKESLA